MANVHVFIPLCLVVSVAWCCRLDAQSFPTPAPPQARPIYLVGGTIHQGNGTVIEDGVLGFAEGKITLVGKAETPFDRTGAEVLDIRGKHVYPGLIAVNTTLGLVEIEAVRATNDDEEVGSINPHVRSLIAYNAESAIIPTVRFNGVLLAMVAPRGGLVSGRSSVVELDAWNWEDAVLKADIGIHVNFPVPVRQPGAQDIDRKAQDEAYTKQLHALYQLFREAQAYAKSAMPKEKNLRLEAMRGLFDGSKKLFIRAHHAKAIIAAVQFAREFGITPIIVGGADSWLVADVLKAYNVPVMLEGTHVLPQRWSDDIEQPYKTPALLHKTGILFCIGGLPQNWQQRNLAFQAGTAAAFGLDKEAALSAITRNPAIILGIEHRVGTLEVGKDATLFVSEGDALDMRGNRVEYAYIRGKRLQLTDKQKFLYEQYKAKYGQR
ncbi:MAG: amidohydrolase family protein [Bacteroidota bacterium]|nr:amidohydrolase family protein [Candidatus Kapabacteria bacterium]MDW8220143.1 amidohydrolase family protein [Bacteroidota bacterium]